MTQREKLIELIQRSVDGCAEYWASVIADHLIAHGVVVLPCKVGDTVYRLFDGEIEHFVVNDISQKMSGDFVISAECDIHGYGLYQYQECKEEFCGRNGACYTQFFDYEIGKTAFFTSKEAEKALKGGAENG